MLSRGVASSFCAGKPFIVSFSLFISSLFFLFGGLYLFSYFAHATPAGDNLIITEVEFDPSGAESEAEWFEFYNPTGATIDIGGWTIEEGGGDFYTFSSGTTISSGAYLLIVNDTAGFNAEHPTATPDIDMDGLYCYRAEECLRLNNTGMDDLTLRDGPVTTGATIDYVSWGTGGYADADNGESICRASSSDTDGGADWLDDCVPTPGEGPYATINVDPTDIQIDGADTVVVMENSASGEVAGVLTTTDPDVDDVHVYSLVSGVGDEDNGLFTIASDELTLDFVPDFEVPVDLGDTAGDNTYSVRIETDDGEGGTFEKVLIVEVGNVDETEPDVDMKEEDDEEDDENDAELHRPRDVEIVCSAEGILVIWKDKSKGEDGFKVRRSVDGVWSTIKRLRKNRENWTDREIERGHTYQYKVRAYEGSEHSRYEESKTCEIPKAFSNRADSKQSGAEENDSDQGNAGNESAEWVVVSDLGGRTLALRESPKSDSETIKTLSGGEKLKALAISYDKRWYWVEVGSHEGWVSAEFVQEIE